MGLSAPTAPILSSRLSRPFWMASLPSGVINCTTQLTVIFKLAVGAPMSDGISKYGTCCAAGTGLIAGNQGAAECRGCFPPLIYLLVISWIFFLASASD